MRLSAAERTRKGWAAAVRNANPRVTGTFVRGPSEIAAAALGELQADDLSVTKASLQVLCCVMFQEAHLGEVAR